jgi:SnoaL-like protein
VTPEDLVEIEAIKRLKYRYARLLDTKSFDELAGCFVPDASASFSGGQLAFQGRDAIIGFFKAALGSPEMVTTHAMGQPEIELTGPESARGTWGLQDVVILAEQNLEIRGASFYSDEYVKVDGEWRFPHTGYRRVWEQMGPRVPETKMTASWFENEGRSSIVAQ